MILIILSHTSASDIYSKIYTPVFLSGYFWISGYMTKGGRSFRRFLASKLNGLIIPFVTLGIMNAVIAIVIEGDSVLNRLQFLISRRGIWDDLWFIACLLSTQCIFCGVKTVCNSVDKKHTLKYWILLLCISTTITICALYYVEKVNVPLPYQFENACISLLFMVFGYLWKALEKKVSVSQSFLGLINFLLYVALILVFNNDVSVHNAQYGSFFIYALSSLSGIFVLTTFCKNVEKNPHADSFIRAMVFVGQNTLVYYAFQSKVIKVFKLIATYLSLPQDAYIFPLAVTALTAIVLAIPAIIMTRYFPILIGKKKTKP